MVTGIELGRAAIGGAVQDVALGGDTLYVLTSGTLHAVSLDDLSVVGSVASPGSVWAQRSRLFVGGGIAYATHPSGYNTFTWPIRRSPLMLRNTQRLGETDRRQWFGTGVAAVGPNLQGDRDTLRCGNQPRPITF
jgi:hypothetical protein